MDDSRTNPFRVNPSPQQHPDAAVYWTALVQDSGCLVTVFDQAGKVEFTNDPAHAAAAQQNTLTILDLYPEALAEERLRILRRALSTASGITLVGMVGGKLCRDTFRPLTAQPDGVGRVLLVSSEVGTDAAQRIENDEHLRAVNNDAGPLESLTKREIEVLTQIGKGLSTADIAKALHRSVKTVEWHRVSLGNKLGVSNRVELARIAIRAGLCSINE